MKAFNIFLINLAVFLVPFCSSGQNLAISKSGKISFFSEARFENIEASSKSVSSVLNTEARDIAFKVPIRSFTFKNALMQEHFNENYMESDTYPEASFTGKISEEVDFSKEGTYKVTASGKLTIHGITRERNIPGTILIKNDIITIKSDFEVPVSDHKIDIPNDKLSNISQNIKITIESTYKPYVK